MLSKQLWNKIQAKIIEYNSEYKDIVDWNLLYSTYYSDYFQLKFKRKYKEMPEHYLIEIMSMLIYSGLGQYFVILKTDSEMKKNWEIIKDYTSTQITDTNASSNTQNYSETDPYNLSDNTYDSSNKSESDSVNSGKSTVKNEDKSKYLNSLNTIRNWLQSNNIYSKILDKLMPLYHTTSFSDCFHHHNCLCDDDYGLDYNETTDLINEALDRLTLRNEIEEAEAVRGDIHVQTER